jgi:NAD(P)-dependent dehydrogenase (short-subunit alcohol dehydrogenase family)
MRLTEKVAIVTGGASGMGRESAIAFAEAGARVSVADIEIEGARETASEIREAGMSAEAMGCDVSSGNQVRQLVDQTMSVFGRLDVVVNFAGRPSPIGLEALTEAEWDETFAVNVRSVYLTAQAAAPAIRESGGGSIINIASAAALMAMGGQPAYCAAKGAIVSLTRALALELCDDGIRVNCICPGTVRTPMMESYYASAFPNEQERADAKLHRRQSSWRRTTQAM